MFWVGFEHVTQSSRDKRDTLYLVFFFFEKKRLDEELLMLTVSSLIFSIMPIIIKAPRRNI